MKDMFVLKSEICLFDNVEDFLRKENVNENDLIITNGLSLMINIKLVLILFSKKNTERESLQMLWLNLLGRIYL